MPNEDETLLDNKTLTELQYLLELVQEAIERKQNAKK